MNSISDVILFIWDWLKVTNWHFALFGKEWDLSILTIILIPLFANFTIFIITHIIELVRD